MAPKRKAAGPVKGNVAKRVASGMNTPRTEETSDDEYMTEDADEIGAEDDVDMDKLVDKFSMSSYAKHTQPTRSSMPGVFKHDYSYLTLKSDHADRPLWIDPDRGRIIMESFSPRFKEAESFLINIAEPQSRVSLIHEYTLTPHSLFAAVSVGLTTEDILQNLDSLSKTPLPTSVIEFVTTSTKSFGKVRLVLKHNKYWIESNDPVVLQTLLQDPIVKQARVDSAKITTEAAPKMGGLVISGTNMAAGAKQTIGKEKQEQENPAVDAD